MDSLGVIRGLIDGLVGKCSSWIRQDNGESYFVDPIDGVEISAHYGATHTAAALILLGQIRGDDALFRQGYGLMGSVLNRWSKSITSPAFHYDFNNFALCAVESTLHPDDELANRIHEIVLKTQDSNHDTINWLPMRAYVNKKRYD